MAKYHQKPDGTMAICRATKRPCRYGEAFHTEANSIEEAQRMADEHNERDLNGGVKRVNASTFARSMGATLYYTQLGVVMVPTDKTREKLTKEEQDFYDKNKDNDELMMVTRSVPSSWVDAYVEDNNDVYYYINEYDSKYDVTRYMEIERDKAHFERFISCDGINKNSFIYNEDKGYALIAPQYIDTTFVRRSNFKSAKETAERFNGEVAYDGLGESVFVTEKTRDKLTKEEQDFYDKIEDKDSIRIVSMDTPETWIPGYEEGDESVYNFINKDDKSGEDENYRIVANSEYHFKQYLSGGGDLQEGVDFIYNKDEKYALIAN